MPKLFDRVKVNIATMGTGSVTFGPPSSPAFLTPEDAGALDGHEVRYTLVDGTDFEEGVGTIFSSVERMARTTVTRSKIGGNVDVNRINLSGTAVLVFTASAADILNPENNLSDLKSASVARSNLGLGSAATSSASAFLQSSNNLSDLANPSTARDNLGLGSAALLSSGAVALVANNLSDLANKPTVRTNLGAVGVIRVRTFLASGTYVPHSKLLFAYLEVVGGGGAGGGVSGNASYVLSGGGGGGGGYAFKLCTAADIGASKTVTIGAGGAGGTGNGGNGGATSIGSLCAADGGYGGAQTHSGGGYHGGSPGYGTIGDILRGGEYGSKGHYMNAPANFLPWLGAGGASRFGPGAAVAVASIGSGTGGTNAASNGGGGGSGAGYFSLAGNGSGGNGGSGIAIVTEFCTE